LPHALVQRGMFAYLLEGRNTLRRARYRGLRMSLKWKLIWPAAACALLMLIGLAAGPVPALIAGHVRSGLLIVVAVGGLGNIKGPFVAALAIGISDTACRYFVPEAGSIFIFVFVFVVLIWRPNGIMDRRRVAP